jgi:hypothetical protein
MKWTGSAADDAEFAKQFLLQHSPLKRVGKNTSTLSKALWLLARELVSQIGALDNGPLLLKIDATTPTSDPAEVSYRYPFRHNGDYVSPASYSDWDLYQGDSMAVKSAVGRLIGVVRDELKLFGRTPK